MALFFNSVDSNTGVLILTHKEAQLIYASNWTSPLRAFGFRALTALHPAKKTRKLIDEKRKEGLIVGVHVGFAFSNPVSELAAFDFAMTREGALPPEQNYGNCRVLPLASRDFVPEMRDDLPREIDHLCVAHNHRRKRIALFLQMVRERYDHAQANGTRLPRVVLICPKTPWEAVRKNYWGGLERQYRRRFSADEHESFTLLRPKRLDGRLGLPHWFVQLVFERAKISWLMSSAEGSAKVVAEADAGGCLLALPSDLTGPTLDHLTSFNGRLFDPSHLGVTALELEQLVKRDGSSRSERSSTERKGQSARDELSKFLSTTFSIHLNVEDLYELNLRLPAHSWTGMPWLSGIRRRGTSDVIYTTRLKAFNKFLTQVGTVS